MGSNCSPSVNDDMEYTASDCGQYPFRARDKIAEQRRVIDHWIRVANANQELAHTLERKLRRYIAQEEEHLADRDGWREAYMDLLSKMTAEPRGRVQ